MAHTQIVPLTDKRLSDATAADVKAFVESEPAESDNLELKEFLPAKGGELDPWHRGENRIGDRARNEILEEICAFANAHGGLLLLGIRESDDHPKRAKGITPVGACADLANRIRLQIRDCIEPPLAVAEVEGIVTESDGSGVVAIRTESSGRGPHRVTTTRECTVRRADRSERLTMREIQELTMVRSSRLSDIDRLFEKASSEFRNANERRVRNIYAMRGTAILLSTGATVERLFRNAAVRPVFGAYRGTIGQSPVVFTMPREPYNERPVLRGVELSTTEKGFGFAGELHEDGLVNYSWWAAVESPEEDRVFPEWVAATAMNVFLTCERFRRAAGAPSAEYAVEFELHRIGGPLRVARWGGRRMLNSDGIVDRNPVIFPRLSFGERSEASALVGVLYRDLLNAAGMDIGDWPLLGEVPAA